MSDTSQAQGDSACVLRVWAHVARSVLAVHARERGIWGSRVRQEDERLGQEREVAEVGGQGTSLPMLRALEIGHVRGALAVRFRVGAGVPSEATFSMPPL